METGITMQKQSEISLLQWESINIMICTHGLDLITILLIEFGLSSTFLFRHLHYLFHSIFGLHGCFKVKHLTDGGKFSFHHALVISLELS